MTTKVWVAERGTGKRKRYVLRWYEDVHDGQGRPVFGADGKLQRRWCQESCKTQDRVTARSLAQRKFDEVNGVATPKGTARVTIAELLNRDAEWLQNRLRSTGTTYLSRLALQHLAEALGGTPETVFADSIGPKEVEAFIGNRREHLEPKSVNRELGNLRATFNRAVKVYGLLAKNPFSGIEALPLEQRPIHPLTAEDEGRLRAACASDRELAVYVRLALDTGCRAGELSHLRWTNLDLKAGMGVVESCAEWRTKTRRDRHIAFTPETAARLREWQRERGLNPMVFADATGDGRVHYHHIRRKFDAAAKRAGLEGRTLHDLRRTVGSLLAARGVNQKVAAEILGHSDIRTTARYYQNVSPETIRDTVLTLRPAIAG